jgi:hypothetical protein
MGIARRKAGTVVRCPSCASQVTVPEVEEPGARPRKEKDPGAPLFERSDFDEIFNPGPVRPKRSEPSPFAFDQLEAPPAPELPDVYKKPEPPKPEPPVPPPAPEKKVAPSSPPAEGTPARPGIWLTPGMATLLSVAAVVALALAFAAGLLVGSILFQSQPPDEKTARDGAGPSLAAPAS